MNPANQVGKIDSIDVDDDITNDITLPIPIHNQYPTNTQPIHSQYPPRQETMGNNNLALAIIFGTFCFLSPTFCLGSLLLSAVFWFLPIPFFIAETKLMELDCDFCCQNSFCQPFFHSHIGSSKTPAAHTLHARFI